MSGGVEEKILPVEAECIIDEWLNTATKDLCQAARDRIRREVTDHSCQVRSRALRQGASETEALTVVVESLGDAARARKQFGRHHLTQSEYNNVESFRSHSILYLVMMGNALTMAWSVVWILSHYLDIGRISLRSFLAVTTPALIATIALIATWLAGPRVTKRNSGLLAIVVFPNLIFFLALIITLACPIQLLIDPPQFPDLQFMKLKYAVMFPVIGSALGIANLIVTIRRYLHIKNYLQS